MISFDAKPTPVDKPPDITTSHVLLTCIIARLTSSQTPHTSTCTRFLPITVRLCAVSLSLRLKWYFINATDTFEIYEKMNQRETTVTSDSALTLRLLMSMKRLVNNDMVRSLRLNTSAAQYIERSIEPIASNGRKTPYTR